jgi:hypothetical protein
VAVPDVNITAVANDGTMVGKNTFMVDSKYGFFIRPLDGNDYRSGLEQSDVFILKGQVLTVLRPLACPYASNWTTTGLYAGETLISSDGSSVYRWSSGNTHDGKWFSLPATWSNENGRQLAPWQTGVDVVASGSTDLMTICGNEHVFEPENGKRLPYVFSNGEYKTLESRANATYWVDSMSPDGTAIAGSEFLPKNYHVVLWRNRKLVVMNTPEALRTPGNLHLFAVSALGKLAIGSRLNGHQLACLFHETGARNNHAVICDGDEVCELGSYLAEKWGLSNELVGWHLVGAYGISSDGKTIIGQGINPKGVLCVFAAIHG